MGSEQEVWKQHLKANPYNAIEKYLKKIGWSYIPYLKKLPNGKHIVGYSLKIKGKHSIYQLYIVPQRQRAFIDFLICDYFLLPKTVDNQFFRHLTEMNSYFYGNFSFNSETNSLNLRVIFPFLKGKFTFLQFWQCLVELLSTAESYYEPISEIIEKNRNVNHEPIVASVGEK